MRYRWAHNDATRPESNLYSLPSARLFRLEGSATTIVPATQPTEPDSPVRRRTHYLIAAALYVLLAGLFIHDWDGFVFEKVVRDFWDGNTPYAVAEDQPFYTFLGINDAHPQWYAYPPLPLLAMSISYLPEILLDVPPFLERILLKLPMVLGTLFVAFVGESWAKHLGKTALVGRRVRSLLLFNPFLILIGPVWGMTDPALIAIFLFGALRFQQGRNLEAGLFVGLATLIKPFPILLSLPLASFFLYERGWRPVGRAFTAACVTVLAVCLPFVVTTPRGFFQQIVLFHLARPVQGLSIWRLVPAEAASAETIEIASFALLSASLLLLAFLAPRVRSPAAPLLITLAASVQILFWNRIVNDQYLVLAVAPLLLLFALGELESKTAQHAARIVPAFLAVFTIFIGWHFLTFIPPDIALPAFGKPVDAVAEEIRQHIQPIRQLRERIFPLPDNVAAVLFVIGMSANLFLSYRFARRWIPALSAPTRATPREMHSRAYAAAATLLVIMVPILPVGAPEIPDIRPEPSQDEPLIGAFYYLWWHNPAHDPTIRYGNWLKVSQTPEMGYYTNTRGVARDHVRMMLENGIDVAVVSYHSSEQERMRVFMEEAAEQGLLVAPLIELNQIYDQFERHALGPDGRPVGHAAYRLDNGTRIAIEDFVLQLADLMGPTAPLYRVDGRPVVFFYDSYVSAISYDEPTKRLLAKTLLESFPLETLRTAFADPDMRPTIDDALLHFPTPGGTFKGNPSQAFYEGNRTPSDRYPGFTHINQSAYWRIAHLNLHRDFWNDIRANLAEEMGPLFLVSGEAFNEHAGFEAGIVKGFVANDAFDGTFIYSPSFVWGNHPRDGDGNFKNSYGDIFQSWEDRNIWLTAATEGDNRFSSYGIAPAYDDTVNRAGFFQTEDPDLPNRSFGFKIPAYTDQGTTYDLMWGSVLRHRPDLVLVATFNEFFEGSSIEPSLEFGDEFLVATKAYRDVLSRTPVPRDEVVVITHERSSRTHPAFSEADRPHEWGLRLTAAVARAYTNTRVVAIDALDTSPGQRGPPSLLVIDGGRDAYDASTLSSEVQAMLAGWVSAGVPMLVVGREVAAPIRDLIPETCRDNAVLPIGHAVVADRDDELDLGDVVRFETDGPTYASLQRNGSSHPLAYRCPSSPQIAFSGIKPWAPNSGWVMTHPTDVSCLKLLTAPLVPQLADGHLPAQCTMSEGWVDDATFPAAFRANVQDAPTLAD